MTSSSPKLLVEVLVSQNIITPEAAAEIEQESVDTGKSFGELLVHKNLISDKALLQLKSELYQLPAADLSSAEIDKESFKNFPDNLVSVYKIVPFAKTDQLLKVGVMDPENARGMEALKFISADMDVTVEKYVIGQKDFDSLSRNFKTLTQEVGRALETFSKDQLDKELSIDEKTGKLEDITAEAPATRVVAIVVKYAVENKASDIHIEPFGSEIRVRFRIDGDLQTSLTLPSSLLSSLISRIKVLSDMKIDETRLAQDGRFSTTIGSRTVDFRVSTFPTRTGEKVVLRILDPFVGDIELTDLGLEGRNLNLILENIAKPFGSILITGPTGSGKSTTLAAILRKMNDEVINIVTLEDPIEYYVTGVNQSQVHEEIGYTFASGLRHILRQDPDVIMVGEIRDKETAGLAIQAALTGHIVLSTIHTNNTIGVIPRLIDMSVEKYLIAPALNLVVAQRLLRRLCSSCKVPDKANLGEEALIKKVLANLPKDVSAKYLKADGFKIFRAGGGCKECNGKQYKGRIAIVETLAMTDELEKVILTDISEKKLRDEARHQGMITMYEDGVMKVLNGVSTFEELLQVANEIESGENKNDEVIE
ncbi:MAG: type IV pilus assembly protein PilB [Parcubacteria group bacterium Licking1014_17]|nr:MAG: type IV pilus assembly protein PilB [Parcubacteria group bacterium Licking1014_17]